MSHPIVNMRNARSSIGTHARCRWGALLVAVGASACTVVADLQRFNDARLVGDGGVTDGGSLPDGGNSFCEAFEPAPNLCVDFETNGVQSWTEDIVKGTVVVDGSRFKTATLKVSANELAAGESSYQRKRYPVPSRTWTKLTLRLDVNIAARDAAATQDFHQLKIGEGNAYWAVNFRLDGNKVLLVEERPNAMGSKDYFNHPLAATIPTDEWKTIEMVVNREASLASVSVTVGSVQALQNDRSFDPRASSQFTEIVIGTNYLKGPLKPTVFYLDNIVIRYE